jgi:hypothetical protein
MIGVPPPPPPRVIPSVVEGSGREGGTISVPPPAEVE